MQTTQHRRSARSRAAICCLGAAAILLASTAGCATAAPSVGPIAGLSDRANQQLAELLDASADHPGRRVAVFDGDGTVLGQAPHYLADECLYAYAQAHPEWNPEVLARMVARPSNVSIAYVQDRVHYFAGLPVAEVRELGARCYREHYVGKLFAPMREVVTRLHEHGFEVWVVTGSPEALYEGFLADALGIPTTRLVGVKSVVREGVISDEIVAPVPQDHGKREAIETFVRVRPLLVAGNSRGDKEMIEHSAGLRLIVNPDEFVAPDQTESMAAYAERMGWLVVRIPDVPVAGFPAISSKVYGVRTNKTRGVSPGVP